MKEGIKKITGSPSRTFLTFCFCFILGSALPTLFDVSRFHRLGIFYLLCALISGLVFFWEKQIRRFYLLILIFIIFGILRAAIFLPSCRDGNKLCYLNGRNAVFTGRIVAEPSRRVAGAEYIIRSKRIFFDDGEKTVRGKVLIKLPSYPEYFYGDVLKIKCDLQSPAELVTGPFRYDKYLERYKVQSVCFYPDVEKTGEQTGVVLKRIFGFKKKMGELGGRLWPEPEAPLVAGIIYGARSGLPVAVSDAFSKTGLSHIMAVSGYNITIIIAVLLGMFTAFGLYRQQAYYLILIFIIYFVVLTGLSASAVRAAIMGIAILTAKQAGRGGRVFNVLVFTAALMQLFNPYLVFWDAGFQLSFLATAGLVYLNPLIEEGLGFLPGFIRGQLSTTLSAIAMTLPLMLYQFGTLSLIAPVANILVLWIVPYLMLFGALALGLAFVYFPFAVILAFITHAGLSYVIMSVRFFAGLPWASVEIKIPLFLMLTGYLILLGIIYEKNKSS